LRLKSGHEGLRLGFHLGLKLQEKNRGMVKDYWAEKAEIPNAWDVHRFY
jgi:hypothetical protein